MRWLPLIRCSRKPKPSAKFSKSAKETFCNCPSMSRFSNLLRFMHCPPSPRSDVHLQRYPGCARLLLGKRPFLPFQQKSALFLRSQQDAERLRFFRYWNFPNAPFGEQRYSDFLFSYFYIQAVDGLTQEILLRRRRFLPMNNETGGAFFQAPPVCSGIL